MLQEAGASCELVLPDGETIAVGHAPPSFRVSFRTQSVLDGPLTELSLGRAYVEGDIDIEGDMLSVFDLRDSLRYGLAVSQKLRFAYELFISSRTRVNRRSVAFHYSFGDDFYLTFMDTRYRFYSHCLFHSDDETLEEAAEHKLESMWQHLGLQPGMRLLDIGGGWGGVPEYCGARGVHVTSLTLAEDSARFIRRLIEEKGLTAEVRLEDFLEHRVEQPYDHVVIFGVIEHIPNYRLFAERLWDVLKPGGRLYLDASAAKQKFSMTPFAREYLWPGTATFLALPDLLEELLFNGFEVLEVKRETRDYELTFRHWAERLDAAHEEVVERWSESLHRVFRMLLWGGAHACKVNRLQAYHVVAERRADRGPRPGKVQRLGQFAASLR
jgi:cyclopropane-fatty-acyl-phospholipid synthase